MNTYVKGQTIDFKFKSRDATGAPAALSSGAISIYRGNSTTQTTTGVTLTADFDSVTGMNHVRVVTTDSFYAPGADFEAVLTAGTVDGVSVVGEVVHRFELTQPQTFYVDKANGSDSNDGLTPGTAFATIAGAVAGTYGGALVAARAAGGKTLIKAFPTGAYIERNVIDLLSTVTGTPPIDLDITGCTVRSMASWNARTGGGSGIVFTATSVTWAAGTATATFNTAGLSNYLKTGDSVVITGLTPSGLNGTKTVTISNELQLTYSTAEGGSGTGTGTGSFAITLATSQIGSGITMATGSTVTAHNAVVYACPGQGTTTTYGSAGIYANAIGCRGATHTPAKFYTIRGGTYLGDSDSFFDSSLWTPESPDGLEQKAYVEDAAFIARADAFVVNAGSTHVIGRRLFISVYGPGTVDNFTTDSRALVGALGGRIDLYDSSVLGQNATSKTYAVHAQGSNTSVNLYNTRLQTVSSSGTILDINTEDTSVVRVHDCQYDASKTASAGSSSIAVVPSHGADGGTGSGARTVTATVDDGSTALSSAVIRFTKGAETYSTTTNGSGVATFNLDDGTWTVAITKSGYTFAGTTLVVNGDETATYSMTAISITPASDPGQTVGVLTTRDEQGAAEASVIITFKLVHAPGTDGHSLSTSEFTATSNGAGLLQATLYRSSHYQAKRGTGGWVDVYTPDASSFDLPEVLGIDA